MRTVSGDDFAVCDVAKVPALGDAPVATYATAIREGGRSKGRAIGVLGIHFDWRPQAQAVVDGVRFTEDERARSRVMILDQNRRVLASSDDRGVLEEIVPLDLSGGSLASYAKDGSTIGYALTPGYETYKGLGWYGCVTQAQNTAGNRPSLTSPVISGSSLGRRYPRCRPCDRRCHVVRWTGHRAP